LQSWHRGETRKGVEGLARWWPTNGPMSRTKFIEKIAKPIDTHPDFGRSLGYELVRTAHQADSGCRFVYLWHFKDYSGPACFQFFKTETGWLLCGVQLFDSAVPELIDAATVEPVK
jgi:hypothetical protein